MKAEAESGPDSTAVPGEIRPVGSGYNGSDGETRSPHETGTSTSYSDGPMDSGPYGEV